MYRLEWQIQEQRLEEDNSSEQWTALNNAYLDRCVKYRIAHAPGMPGSFSPPPRVSDPDMHHGTCVTHVTWCMPVSLTNGFLWRRWRGNRSRHSGRMHNPQFYVSGKRHKIGKKPTPLHGEAIFLLCWSALKKKNIKPQNWFIIFCKQCHTLKGRIKRHWAKCKEKFMLQEIFF